MSGYAKIFASLFDGSLRGKPDEILVFVNMLTHSNKEGNVDIHFKAISDETGIPVDRVKEAAINLESPDPESRTPDEEGRRIKRLDDHRSWGWHIINYYKYRMLMGQSERYKELTRLRVADHRARKRGTTVTGNVTATLPAADADASVQKEGGTGETDIELPKWFPRTEKDAERHAGLVGCDPAFAVATWTKAMGRGGLDAKEVPIRSFRHHLQAEWGYEQQRRRFANGATNNRSLYPRDLKLMIDAKQVQIDQHPANPKSLSFNGRPTELERASLKAQRKELADLTNQLATYGQPRSAENCPATPK